MKNARDFFLRLDRVRGYCRAFLLMLIFILIYFRSMTPITYAVVGALTVIMAMGSALRVTRQRDIAERVSDAHADFDAAVRRRHSTWFEEDRHTLDACSPKRIRLVRNIGNRMYFPEIHTMIFHKQNGGMELFVQTLSLYEGGKPQRWEHFFAACGDLVLKTGDAKEDSDYRRVILCDGEAVILEFFVRNDHSWNRFVQFLGEWAVVRPFDNAK